MNFMEAQFSMALAVFLESLSSLQISESSERKREKKKQCAKIGEHFVLTKQRLLQIHLSLKTSILTHFFCLF